MRPHIDFGECLKDSPRFRASLEEAEADIEQLETKLEKLVRLCSSMIDAGKNYTNASSAFITGVRDVSSYFQEDKEVSDDNFIAKTLDKFANGMNELQKYNNILLEQAHKSVCKNVTTFLKNDVKKVKETRKHFEKISDDMDTSLSKNAQAPRSKAAECEEAYNVLTAMRSCFGHTSLDYVFQINILHSRKRFEVLETMLSFMHAQSTFFHQGYDLFEDLEPYMKQIANELDTLSAKAIAEKKEMEERHLLVQQREQALTLTPLPSPPDGNADHDIRMEGYLFKRTSNAFKSWVSNYFRRWFMIQDDQLVYRKRSKDNLTIMEDDLRLCTVKPVNEIDRRFCFEVVSPTRSHMLQADSEAECQKWISAITAAVNKAYRDSAPYQNDLLLKQQEDMEQKEAQEGPSQNARPQEANGALAKQIHALPTNRRQASPAASSSRMSRMNQMISLPGNKQCADCGATEPRWASINLGITLCIECSGIHRSFGVHKSKVRSVTLDTWEPELVKVMSSLGNMAVNKIYEANVDEAIAVRATPHCDRIQREAWIKAKYIQKAFVPKLPDKDVPEDSPVKVRRWSVRKSKRKSSPGAETENKSEGGDNLGLMPNISQGESKDSGLGGSTQDVIVFGAPVTMEMQHNIDDELSEDSVSDHDEDAQSITSLEEVSRLDPNLLLYKAAQARNLPVMLEALANGADPNWHNPKDKGMVPLMKAIGSMTACEFLLLNGAKVDRKDDEGRTPLHHAAVHGMTGQVCQFLKRGANQYAVDMNGMDALNIAVQTANADIVTLLRLSKLNEEMQEADGFLGGNSDETFTEVFRDFTNMANNDPEKLHRHKERPET